MGSLKEIRYGSQSISDGDVEAVTKVLKSSFLTQGSVTPDFEKAIAKRVGSKYCVAASSGTSALHLAYLSLGLSKNDLVWTSPNTFVATANAALMCGAVIDFVDIDIRTGNICAEQLALKLDQARKKNKLPKFLVVVHYSGSSCDMKTIRDLCDPFGIKIIEDASHALGGEYENTSIGQCQYSEACTFSFHPVKMITTGEGGAVTTNNENVAHKLNLFRSHGIEKTASRFSGPDDDAWYYEQQSLGFNYRLPDINAALGLSQLERLDKFLDRRREIASLYKMNLPEYLSSLQIPEQANSSYHLFPVLCTSTQERRSIFEKCQSKGIRVQVHYIPVHRQPYFQNLGFRMGMFPNAESFYSKELSLPIHVELSDPEIEFIIETLWKEGD